MNEVTTIYFTASADAPAEKERWLPVLRAKDYHPDGGGSVTYSANDLDTMVDEYHSRGGSQKAPVVLGKFKDKASPIGTVDDIKRQGDTVLAKLIGLDPKAEQLYDKGVFKKRSVRIERSPEGISLQSVGLIAPQWDGHGWNEDMTPRLDDLHKQQFETSDVTFSDSSHRRMQNIGGIPVDAGSQRLSDLANQRMSSNGITFSEALSQVASENPDLCGVKTIQFGENSVRGKSQKLSDLAKQRARQRQISFGEALSQVANENPELAS